MNAHNHDYFRRRAIAEQIVERDNLMPEFLTGAPRLGMYEQLVNEHMPPAGDEPYLYEAPEREPDPTAEEAALAVGKPVTLSDPVSRATSMAAAVGEDMAAADRLRRGEPNQKGGA